MLYVIYVQNLRYREREKYSTVLSYNHYFFCLITFTKYFHNQDNTSQVEKNGVSQILIDLTKFCNSDSSKEFPFPVKGTARISCNEIKNKYVSIIKQFRIDFMIILYLIRNNLKTFGNIQ